MSDFYYGMRWLIVFQVALCTIIELGIFGYYIIWPFSWEKIKKIDMISDFIICTVIILIVIFVITLFLG